MKAELFNGKLVAGTKNTRLPFGSSFVIKQPIWES